MTFQPRFLMCPPEYFEVAYEINPWMSVKRNIDRDKAVSQWKKYYDLMLSLGAKVELLEPVKGLPDMVFTANAGLVFNNLFIRSNFRHPERSGEELHYEKWFRKNGYQVRAVDRPLNFEGEGDALFMGRELYTGYHFRSDVEAHDQVSALLKNTYFALELCDKRFYHLDTCFAPLNEKTALVYFDAFEPYAQLVLWETLPDPVSVPEEEAVRFACNSVAVENHVIMPEGCPQTAAKLEAKGFTVHPLDFSEFMKAGGAAKCLALSLTERKIYL